MRLVSWTAVVDEEKCKAPCVKTCPAGVKVPVYIDLIKNRRFQEAYEIIQSDNPFPSVCGRVCHSPCESQCRRGKQDAALSVRALKRVPGDQLIDDGLPVPEINKKNGMKVAVIGAGPAGLSASFYLAKKGYEVTVFEAMRLAGGMMMTGIPEFRLPKEILAKEINVITKMGVKIKTGQELGKHISIEQLFKAGHNAIFLAVGAYKDQLLGIPGEDMDGVFAGVKFLYDLNLGDPVDLSGKNVAVIGGGNVAVDAARSAIRLGAKSVTVFYRRTKYEMPALETEVDEMEREGVIIKNLTTPVEVIGENGSVTGIVLKKMCLGDFDKTGRRMPVAIEGSEFTVAEDIIISAVGYNPDTASLDPDLKTNLWGGIYVDPDTMATNIDGVFSGGDCVTGATTIIDAVAAGKKCAAAIDVFLNGDGVMVEKIDIQRNIGEINKGDTRKVDVPNINKVDGFKETELGYTIDQAIEEASRCLQCDMACRICENVCPVLAIHGKRPGERDVAQVDGDYCLGCYACEQRCPEYAITLSKLDEPFTVHTDVSKVEDRLINDLCRKAKFHPDQIVCYCTATRAEEIAAAIILGAKSPEEVSRATGVRTGCKVECIQPILRLLEAAGIKLEPTNDGWQWYGRTPTVWEIREGIKAKYNKNGFYFTEDIQLLDRLIGKHEESS